MPATDKEIISAYNQSRGKVDKSVLCYAPFTNINFEQTGKATACCYNRKHVLGTYPADTINDMWYGEQAELLRSYIREDSLEGGCVLCKRQLESGNFAGFKAKMYDQYAQGTEPKAKGLLNQLLGRKNIAPPRIMEFELENTCNLECIMCNGEFSSSIRKNREQLEPIVSPYDKAFVAQLREYMPQLTEMKFLGGEPFMIDIYHDIWEEVARINPSIKIHITTNATLLNTRTKNLLEEMKAGINISLDSVVKETYEAIRTGANYERVMTNIDWLADYTQRKGTDICFSVCPMVINRYEMPDLVDYANKRGLGVYFNTVLWPEGQSLRSLSSNELDELLAYYDDHQPAKATITEQKNHEQYMGFVNQVRYWKAEKDASRQQQTAIPLILIESLARIPATVTANTTELCRDITEATAAAHSDAARQLCTKDELKLLTTESLAAYLKMRIGGHKPDEVLNAFRESMTLIGAGYIEATEYETYLGKLERLFEQYAMVKDKQLLVNNLIESGVLRDVNYVATTPPDEIFDKKENDINN